MFFGQLLRIAGSTNNFDSIATLCLRGTAIPILFLTARFSVEKRVPILVDVSITAAKIFSS